MLEISTLLFLGVVGVILRALYSAVTRFWWGEDSRLQVLYYQQESPVASEIVKACSTLQERCVER